MNFLSAYKIALIDGNHKTKEGTSNARLLLEHFATTQSQIPKRSYQITALICNILDPLIVLIDRRRETQYELTPNELSFVTLQKASVKIHLSICSYTLHTTYVKSSKSLFFRYVVDNVTMLTNTKGPSKAITNFSYPGVVIGLAFRRLRER